MTANQPACPPPAELTNAAIRAQRCEMEHRHHGYCVDRMMPSAQLLALADTLERQTEALRKIKAVIPGHTGHRSLGCLSVIQVQIDRLCEEALRER